MTTRRSVARIRLLAGVAAMAGLAGCQLYTPYLDPNGRANPDMAAVIDMYQRLGAKPVHTLSVAQARTQPTMDDATRTVVATQRHEPGFTSDHFALVRDLTIEGSAGPLPARLYDPQPGEASQPVILFFHGGGWVTGSAASDELTARALASEAHAKVLSVGYRLAPENRFPAAQDDAVAAYRWVLTNAGTLGADRRRIAVAGQGAGGNLALNVAIAARDSGLAPPVDVLLLDPSAGTDRITPSYIADKNAVPLGRQDMVWYMAETIRSPADLNDKRLDIIGKADLHGLAPVTVISAEIDPLQSDGNFLVQKLQAEGVTVAQRMYAGTTHGFFGTGAAVARAEEAEQFAGQDLERIFDTIGAPKAARPLHYFAPSRRSSSRRRSR